MNRNKKSKKRRLKGCTFHVINITVFLLFSLICIYPFYYIIINTISDNQLVNAGRINIYPVGIHFKNYQSAFKMKGLLNAFYISVLRTAIGAISTVFVSSIPAYIFSRPEVWHRKIFFRLIFLPGYISAGMVATYLNIRNLGLFNNFLVYILDH